MAYGNVSVVSTRRVVTNLVGSGTSDELMRELGLVGCVDDLEFESVITLTLEIVSEVISNIGCDSLRPMV